MTRLDTMSATGIRTVLLPQVNDDLVCLLTLTGDSLPEPLYLADNYTHRLSETDTEIVYGITSNGIDYIYVPMDATLPSEEEEASQRFTVTFYDVTQYVLPLLRQLSGEVNVDLVAVLKSQPDVIELDEPEFSFSDFSYDASTVTCTCALPGDESEPVPVDSITPGYFPGAFS